MATSIRPGRPFLKMQGLGNDFAIFDLRGGDPAPSAEEARAIGDRRRGIGCDQIITIEGSADADAFMGIWNPDGSRAGACGNATRCVARILMDEVGTDAVTLQTDFGLLRCDRATGGLVRAEMGVPKLDWADIPLAQAVDTVSLALSIAGAGSPGAVSMGNPHCVFFVDDAERFAVAEFGPQIETHPLFPRRTNVEFCQILAPDRIRMRVWERGAGITQACGSGACAALVAAARKGLTGRRAELVLDGGSLLIEWREGDGVVTMTGPTTHSYSGLWPLFQSPA